jgi:hypothetical protein
VTEYMLHASVDVSVPGGEEPRRTASPDLAGREAVRAPISRPVVEHPGAVNTLAETIPPADSPPLSELPEQTLLAGVIPVDLAAVADEAREFLGHVADLGADWAEGVDWPDYGWLAVSALLTGGFAHIAFVHRRRTALTVDAARAAPTPGESTR